ncbi:MAG: hypothetical protein IBJ10_09490 [Phycisphaerales bacterium]|nr:hypothetical protein [Phycisphaerales bacterium]
MTQCRDWTGAALFVSAGATLASGGIVYTDIPDITLLEGEVADLDVDGDGGVDITMQTYVGGSEIYGRFGAEIYCDSYPAAAIIESGSPIGSSLSDPGFLWFNFGAIDANFGKGTYDWPDHGAYLAFRLDAGDDWRYGWMFVASTINPSNPGGALTIFDFAFESTPNESILAGAVPAPGTLGALALGAAALARRGQRMHPQKGVYR